MLATVVAAAVGSDVDWDRRTPPISRLLTVIRRQATEGPTRAHQRRDIADDDTLGVFIAHHHEQQRVCAETVGVSLRSRSRPGCIPP